MKKLLRSALAFLLAVTLLPFSVVFAENGANALPKVGDVVHGFEVKDVRDFDLLSADVVLFEHQKTGALLMYLSNEDTNRTFEITFRTPAETQMGVSHVFEHSTLNGSKKYPSKALFFNLIYQTYNTYMNASTYNIMTTYPVASLSEEQLLRYVDYYTDSCFNPIIYENPDIFTEEAWRYAMDSADGDLTIAGTVYSEMQGSYTLQSAASYNFLQTLFPGSTVGNSHGGIPEHIPEMTNEDLLAYHQAYYHPSNSLTCLYGSFDDYGAFLKLLDGYFSAYEKKEFVIEDKNYVPLTEAVEKSFAYGVEASSSTENASTAYYGIVVGEVDEVTLNQLDLLTTLLSSNASVLMQNLKAALPAASTGCYVDFTGPEVAIIFYADAVNKGDEVAFRKVVDESLAQIAEEGFKAEDVEALIAATQLDVQLISESSSIGTDMIPNIAYYWASTDDVYGYMDFIDSLALFGDYAEDGTFKRVISEHLVGNPRTALTITYPVPGLKEQQDAALAAKLAEIKAGMTAEEIDAIVAQTAALAEDTDDGSAAQYVAQLQAVTVDNLPEEARIYTMSDTTDENGVRSIHAEADADGVGTTLMLLDASGLEQEELHYFKLFVDLLGELDTDTHTRGELASLITRYLYGANIRVSVLEDDSADEFTPYLRVTFTAMDEDMTPAYDLVGEILYSSKLDDVQRVKDTVEQIKANLKASMTADPYSIQLYRAYAQATKSFAYFNYVSYLDYYAFLEDLQAKLESEPEAVIAALQGVQKYFNNSQNAVIGFAGSKASNANHEAAAKAFLAKLGKTEIAEQSYDIPATGMKEAIALDSAVQYNMRFATFEQLGMEGYTGALDAVSALVTDSFLYPLLRDQYGAYSVIHGAADAGVYLISYRDPNIAETFDVYNQLPELVKGLSELDQETLDGYILSCYSYYAQSQGELTGAMSAVLNTLEGKPQEQVLDYMRQLKGITAESVAAYADMYQKLVDNGLLSTSGAMSAINAHADLYDVVLNPFGAQDTSKVVFKDIVEGDRYYEAVRFVYENALMQPLANDNFGAGETATLGELISALYMAVGGNGDPVEGIAFLSQYGVLDPSSTPDEIMPREDLAVYLWCFCYAIGMDVKELPMGLYPDAGDVLAEIKPMVEWVLKNGIMLTDEDHTIQPKRPATRAEVAYALMSILGTP